MYLVDKYAYINLNVHNTKHFENLGYYIPRDKGAKGYDVVKRGTKIKVKIEDIPHSSGHLVNVRIGIVDKMVPYSKYIKAQNENKKIMLFLDDINKEEFTELWNDEDNTTKDIAELYECHRETITKWSQRLGLETKSKLPENLSGERFGRWMAIKRVVKKEKNTNEARKNRRKKYSYHTYYLCQCNCDLKTKRLVYLNDLKSGASTSCGCKSREYVTEVMVGENHPNYNPNLTTNERKNLEKYHRDHWWTKKIFRRDNYTCQVCKIRSGVGVGRVILNAHHINGYDWCKEGRTDEDNGITLCEDCHKMFHSEYGYGSNTAEQFNKFVIQNEKQAV